MSFEDKESITNLKKELLLSEQLLHSCMNSQIKNTIFSVDKNYNLLCFNDNYKELIKNEYNIDIHVGMNISAFISVEKERFFIIKQCDEALLGKRFSTIEKLGKSEIKYYEISFAPITDVENVIIGVTSTSKDITEKNR